MVLGLVKLVGGAEPSSVGFITPESSPADANEGHLLIQWTAAKGSLNQFELQQSPTESFAEARVLYRGPDTSSFVTGLPAGSTFFRVRGLNTDGDPGSWSPPLKVVVRFPAMGKVIVLILAGGVMLLVLAWTILRGSSRQMEGATSDS